jgi:hypothetical protein
MQEVKKNIQIAEPLHFALKQYVTANKTTIKAVIEEHIITLTRGTYEQEQHKTRGECAA